MPIVTRLDQFRGEHRNHDLLLVGSAGGERTVVGVEAKNDEDFGRRIGDYHALRSSGDVRSNVPARIELLVEGLFWTASGGGAALRYQLFTAAAGT
jgi:hypothetical protein